uniref:Uncharacterized protein LOC109683126 n=1 Tax=Castor canadensis TaxID=51338 RepID=A0A8B7U4D2_CASCN|nr:uncharacterized protein LOC109683126 [Castor canadensis]
MVWKGLLRALHIPKLSLSCVGPWPPTVPRGPAASSGGAGRWPPLSPPPSVLDLVHPGLVPDAAPPTALPLPRSLDLTGGCARGGGGLVLGAVRAPPFSPPSGLDAQRSEFDFTCSLCPYAGWGGGGGETSVQTSLSGPGLVSAVPRLPAARAGRDSHGNSPERPGSGGSRRPRGGLAAGEGPAHPGERAAPPPPPRSRTGRHAAHAVRTAPERPAGRPCGLAPRAPGAPSERRQPRYAGRPRLARRAPGGLARRRGRARRRRSPLGARPPAGGAAGSGRGGGAADGGPRVAPALRPAGPRRDRPGSARRSARRCRRRALGARVKLLACCSPHLTLEMLLLWQRGRCSDFLEEHSDLIR